MNNVETKTLFEQEPLEMKTFEPIETKAMARSNINTDCIAKLYITFPNGKTYQGTGFLYGNNVLATAGHCVFDPRYGGEAKSIRVVLNNTSYWASDWTAAKKWYDSTTSNMSRNWKYDYGVITLNATPGRTLGFLDYWIASDSQLKGKGINVPGFVAGSTSLNNTSGTLANVRTYDLYFTAGFASGKSGSPIIMKDNGMFVGIGNYGASTEDGYPSGARITYEVADFLDENY